MSIKESALAAITSIAQGDFVRAVTSAGASRRITVTNLAKAIVESYTGSSLAGSNQSVKAALDSLNSKIAVEVKQSGSQTIPNGDRGVYTINLTRTGYTPIGIIGVALSNNWLYLGSADITGGSNAQVVVHNRSSASADNLVTVRVLYLKN